MVLFIEDHRDVYGVELICAMLPIAPSTYFLHKAQRASGLIGSITGACSNRSGTCR